MSSHCVPVEMQLHSISSIQGFSWSCLTWASNLDTQQLHIHHPGFQPHMVNFCLVIVCCPFLTSCIRFKKLLHSTKPPWSLISEISYSMWCNLCTIILNNPRHSWLWPLEVQYVSWASLAFDWPFSLFYLCDLILTFLL